MPLYFAYGSNIDREAMAQRCPESRPLGAARLIGHRFMITADGYASVVREPRGTVWGLLWDMALADVPALDRYESVGTGLYTKTSHSVLTANGPRRALLYIARSLQPGLPQPDYIAGIVAAARATGLPADHIRSLEAWLPATQRTVPAVGRPSIRPLWASPVARRPGNEGRS